MDRGHIVEEGDRGSLLARGGLYARLRAHQSGGSLTDEANDQESRARPDALWRRLTRGRANSVHPRIH